VSHPSDLVAKVLAIVLQTLHGLHLVGFGSVERSGLGL
jgi:hypothetical protein